MVLQAYKNNQAIQAVPEQTIEPRKLKTLEVLAETVLNMFFVGVMTDWWNLPSPRSVSLVIHDEGIMLETTQNGSRSWRRMPWCKTMV